MCYSYYLHYSLFFFLFLFSPLTICSTSPPRIFDLQSPNFPQPVAQTTTQKLCVFSSSILGSLWFGDIMKMKNSKFQIPISSKRKCISPSNLAHNLWRQFQKFLWKKTQHDNPTWLPKSWICPFHFYSPSCLGTSNRVRLMGVKYFM